MRKHIEDPGGVLPAPGCPIEEHHVEAALRQTAILMVRYGERLVPLFERFEADLAEIRKRRSPLERARALVEAHTSAGGVGGIAAP